MTQEFVVGILYPALAASKYQGELDALRALDPRIRLIIEPYEEPLALHNARTQVNPDLARLRSQCPALSDRQLKMFAEVDAVLTLQLPLDIRALAPRLKWVQGVGAGTLPLQSSGLADAGIRLTSSAGGNAVAIAEFVIGRILQEWKRFREIDRGVEQRRWEAVWGEQLAGQTVGLIGLGAINTAVAARLKPFGMRILATRRSQQASALVDRIYAVAEIDSMLAESDVVVAAVPGTRETAGLMNRERFAKMRRGAFFCNVGRGSLVDESALIDALRSGRLRAAALDVTSMEPLPAENPLWEAPNLYLSPHCAADPHALFVNLHRLFRENILRFLKGQALLNEVDLAAGY